MNVLFRYDDYLIICHSKDEHTGNLFKACSAFILTSTFGAVTRQGHGVVKKIPFFTANKKDDSDIILALYRVSGEMFNAPFQEIEPLILNIIERNNELIQANRKSISVFADKELFEVYFESLNVVDAKFEKIYYQDTEEA